MHRHRHRWRHLRHHVRELQRRGLWPYVVGWRLQRRVFIWIAGLVLLTAVVVALTLFKLRANAQATGWRFYWPVGLAVVVLWAFAGRISHRLMRPLYMVLQVAERLGKGDLKARAPLSKRRRAEERALAKSLNRMADRIERQMSDQRELLAQVSHQLRTPLGHLRLLLEMARENPERKTLDEMEKEVVEIDALVGDLLANSRLSFEALNLRELDARQLASRALERAGVSEEKLSVQGAPQVRGDPTLLGRALGHLIENARDHGNGVDSLTVKSVDRFVQFAVRDRGPGFAEGDTHRAFDAFFHRPRGADGSGGSLGLGLALVQRIARAHGGDARAMNRPEGGAEVAFTIAAT